MECKTVKQNSASKPYLGSISVSALVGYLGMMHLRSFQLLQRVFFTKKQLVNMKRYDSLFEDHEF